MRYSKFKAAANPRKQPPVYLSDARVRDSLNAQGFYDSWITPELIRAHRKVMEAKRRNQALMANAGDYD